MADRFRIVAETLAREMAKPYGYGWSEEASDCFFCGCAVADALDPALGLVERYRGAYSTLAGAQRALLRRGHRSLATLFAEHLTPVAPAMARLGDLAVLSWDGAEHVGICLGTRFVAKTERGRVDRGIGDVVAAFRTGGG